MKIAMCLLFAGFAPVFGQLPTVASGKVVRMEKFPSRWVDARTVDVWLPDGYPGAGRYAVVYMHDGQMLFDAAATWNHQEWKVDETVGRLLKEGKIRDCIVVGVWNNGEYRHPEYFPQKFLAWVDEPLRADFISKALKNKPLSDNYLHFLVEELKPAVDQKFATRPDRDNTFLMGSSMGGLISLYALCEYPAVFGGAACLSTHWIGAVSQNFEFPLAAFNYLKNNLPRPEGRRLYLDFGTVGLDSQYQVHQAFVDLLLKGKGYTEANWMTRKFEGADHNEVAWAARLEIPLLFLLAKPQP